MPSAYDGLAERLIRAMDDAGREALLEAGHILAERTKADIPVGDPTLDPDPTYRLAEHVHVRAYGKYVSVSVEGEYAVKQHEAVHFKHPRGGRAKYLEANAVIMGAELQGLLKGTVQKTFASVRSRVKIKTTSI